MLIASIVFYIIMSYILGYHLFKVKRYASVKAKVLWTFSPVTAPLYLGGIIIVLIFSE